MNRITTAFMVLAGIAFASTPLQVQAAQITPNPNTGTIIIDTPDAFNSIDPFANNGVIAITGTGTLTNTTSGNLTSSGTLTKQAVEGFPVATPGHPTRVFTSPHIAHSCQHAPPCYP